MAMNAAAAKADLKAKIEAAYVAQGRTVDSDPLLAAICEAFGNWLVNQLTTTAKANVTSGSSAGEWPII